jgi:hypothetical protein
MILRRGGSGLLALAAASAFLSMSVAGASASSSVAGASASSPAALTGPVTASGPNSATVAGTVNPNGEATTWYFEYGESATYGSKSASVNAGSGTTNVDITATLSNLAAGTTYHYRLVAANASGTGRGADGIVTTAALPSVATSGAEDVTATTATLTGTVNPNGRPTTWYFDYGTTRSYGTKTAAQSAGSGTSTVGVSTTVSGLRTGRSYHFRIVATSDAGTSRGKDRTVVLVGAPTVVTRSPSSVSTSKANFRGRVTPNGQSTSWYFEYGTSTGYGAKTSVRRAGSGTRARSVSASVSGLTAGTTYHVRLVATNASGARFGGDRTFVTDGPPAAQTGVAQAVGATGATLVGSVDPKGRSTTWYFEYGPTTAYGFRTPSKSAGSGFGSKPVSIVVSNLAPGTLYHHRLVAKSGAGTSRGVDVAFTTLQAVTLTPTTWRSVYGHFVTLRGVVASRQMGVSVTIIGQPFGQNSRTVSATVLTGADGTWSYPVRPAIRTAYQASANGGMSPPVLIGVRPAVSLRTITGARLSTRVVAGTSFAGRFVQLQRRSHGRWMTVKRARLNAKSAAIFHARALPRGRSTIRIAMSVNQAGPGYLGGLSRTIVFRRR